MNPTDKRHFSELTNQPNVIWAELLTFDLTFKRPASLGALEYGNRPQP